MGIPTKVDHKNKILTVTCKESHTYKKLPHKIVGESNRKYEKLPPSALSESGIGYNLSLSAPLFLCSALIIALYHFFVNKVKKPPILVG